LEFGDYYTLSLCIATYNIALFHELQPLILFCNRCYITKQYIADNGF